MPDTPGPTTPTHRHARCRPVISATRATGRDAQLASVMAHRRLGHAQTFCRLAHRQALIEKKLDLAAGLTSRSKRFVAWTRNDVAARHCHGPSTFRNMESRSAGFNAVALLVIRSDDLPLGRRLADVGCKPESDCAANHRRPVHAQTPCDFTSRRARLEQLPDAFVPIGHEHMFAATPDGKWLYRAENCDKLGRNVELAPLDSN